ncbi:Spore germination protein YndE [compost metagenome]
MSPIPKISNSQATLVVLNCMFNAGILILPRTMGTVAGTPNLWISMLLSGLVVVGMGCIIVALCMRFPGKTFFEFTHEITGRWISNILGMAMIIYFLILRACMQT